MADKAKQITVYGTGNDQKVAFWDRHPDHPDGEAFVVNDRKAYKVADVPAVQQAIAERRLTTEKPQVEAEVQEEAQNATAVPNRLPNADTQNQKK